MQDKAIGIVVFLAVGAVITGLGSMGDEGGADWVGLLMGSLSGGENGSLWAASITILAVAGMAMGTYKNGGLSGVDVKHTVLLLALAGMVGGTFPDSLGAYLALAWIITGGLRV